jgi:hypothetical protein
MKQERDKATERVSIEVLRLAEHVFRVFIVKDAIGCFWCDPQTACSYKLFPEPLIHEAPRWYPDYGLWVPLFSRPETRVEVVRARRRELPVEPCQYLWWDHAFEIAVMNDDLWSPRSVD